MGRTPLFIIWSCKTWFFDTISILILITNVRTAINHILHNIYDPVKVGRTWIALKMCIFHTIIMQIVNITLVLKFLTNFNYVAIIICIYIYLKVLRTNSDTIYVTKHWWASFDNCHDHSVSEKSTDLSVQAQVTLFIELYDRTINPQLSAILLCFALKACFKGESFPVLQYIWNYDS